MNKNILFLDQDGTITVNDPEYLHHPEDCEFVPGGKNALRRLWNNGFKIIMATNKSGVGRGYFTQEDLSIFFAWLIKQLPELYTIYYCPHSPIDNCPCRKPKTCMIDDAIRKYNITSLDNVWMIGDSNVDIQTVAYLGYVKTIQTKTVGIASEEEQKVNPNWRVETIVEAVDIILDY